MIRAIIDTYSKNYMKHDNACMKYTERTDGKASGWYGNHSALKDYWINYNNLENNCSKHDSCPPTIHSIQASIYILSSGGTLQISFPIRKKYFTSCCAVRLSHVSRMLCRASELFWEDIIPIKSRSSDFLTAASKKTNSCLNVYFCFITSPIPLIKSHVKPLQAYGPSVGRLTKESSGDLVLGIDMSRPIHVPTEMSYTASEKKQCGHDARKTTSCLILMYNSSYCMQKWPLN